jgi:transposase-like protein
MKAVALQSLGNVTRKLGDFAQAESYYIQGIRLHQQAGRFMDLVECLEGLAGTYLDQGHLGEAACLYGGAAQWREQTGTRVADSERRAYECDLAQLRTALGEQNFLLAWRKGQATPIDKIFVHLTQEMGAAKGEAHYYTKRMQQPHCPRCQQDQYVIKSGFNHTGSQRYRCQHCCHYFTPAPKPEGYDLPLRTHALHLYLEGTSFRAIGRLLGLHHQTVSNWVMQAATALPAPMPDQAPTATIDLDKLYTLVQQKKTRST